MGGRLKCLTHVLSIWPSVGWQKQTWQPFLGAWQTCFRIWTPSEGGLDELALHVTDGDGELVDLKVTEDNFTLEEEHLSLK